MEFLLIITIIVYSLTCECLQFGSELFGNGGGNLNGGGNFLGDQMQVWSRAAGGFLSDQQNLFARAAGNLGMNGKNSNNPAGGLNLGGNLGGNLGSLFNGDPRTGKRRTR